MSLESPHNSMHLAVGGFDLPVAKFSPIRGANGDMGENETASFDPIFYFHHCFVDLVFWLWQEKHDATSELEIIPQYPGTNSMDEQGATPGLQPNMWLDDKSPLHPFRNSDGKPYTSRDCADIEALGYDYEYTGDLRNAGWDTAFTGRTRRAIYVSGVDRTQIRGSFLISAFAEVRGERHLIGTEAVLSRWQVEGCANCQTHLRSSAVFPLPDELAATGGPLATDGDIAWKVQLHLHDPSPMEEPQILLGDGGVLSTAVLVTRADGTEAEAPLYAELRTAER
jgi:tyrosinase